MSSPTTGPTTRPTIRLARPGDETDIVAMIHDLAEFELAPEECTVTESHISAALFGDDAVASCHIVEVEDEVAGMALWFRNFSTWDGVAGIHLEDLFVRPRYRRRGVARALLSALAGECVQRGYSRLSWAVLEWNSDAIALYDSVGGRQMTEWVTYRVSGAELSALASS